MQGQYNRKSPAVKRLMREALELSQPTPQYFAQPLEDNLFEWHFTVTGPADSEFEGGRYHGRVILPPEYPMKPPSIILVTPNGRFETGKKICLSMSAHHPETWQPSWSIRTVLLALIGFMPTKGGGAIGAVDYTPQERRKLADKSQDWRCDVCGISSFTALAPADDTTPAPAEANKEAQELAAQIDFKGEPEKNGDKDTEAATPERGEAMGAQNGSDPATAQTETGPGNGASAGANPNGAQPTVRQRTVGPSPRLPVSNNTASVVPDMRTSDPGYCSLALMWLVAIALVVLIIRRLCLDTVTIQQA